MRKLSKVSSHEMKELDETLRKIFDTYADPPKGKDAAGITSQAMTTFVVDCDLLDGECGTKIKEVDVANAYASVKLGKKNTLKFERFQEAVRKIAMLKGATYQEVIQHCALFAKGAHFSAATIFLNTHRLIRYIWG